MPMLCRSRDLWTIAVAGVVAVATRAVAADMPVADRATIMAGVRSCVAATSEAGVDVATLEADGWHAGTMSSTDGKPVDRGFHIYGRGPLMLMLPEKMPSPICPLIARIAGVRDFALLEADMATAYGAAVGDGRGEKMFLSPDRHVVDVALTGTDARPTVRVAVGPISQEKQ